MTHRSFSSLGAIAICAAFQFSGSSLHAAPQRQPQANHAVSISDAIRDTDGNSGVAQSSTEENQISPEGSEDGDISARAGIENEARPLGVPNGMFSNRPTDPQPTTDESLLSRFDPRQNDILRIIAAMGVVIGLLILLRYILQKTTTGIGGGGRPSGVLEILARYPIARGQQLILLKLGRRIILAHQTSTCLETISEISDADEVAGLLTRIEAGSREKIGSKFRSMLTSFEEDHTRQGGSELKHHALTSPRDGELIDLTQRKRGGILGGIFSNRRASL